MVYLRWGNKKNKHATLLLPPPKVFRPNKKKKLGAQEALQQAEKKKKHTHTHTLGLFEPTDGARQPVATQQPLHAYLLCAVFRQLLEYLRYLLPSIILFQVSPKKSSR